VVTPQLAFGLFIMLVGTALALDQFRIVDAGRVMAFWPAAIIVCGVTVWMRGSDAHGRFWGFALVFIGTSLLLNSLGFVDVRRRDLFVPLLLTALGASLVLRTLQQGGPRS
jgi:hypothetical protein